MNFSEITKQPVYKVFSRPTKVADVGIELEIEGMGLPDSAPHWQAKAEGSLQGGMEYITKPIKIDAVETYVNNLKKFIVEGAGATIKNSYRCSTHIHMNVLPNNLEDVLGMLVIWTMFEPVLLSLCGPQRDGNLFCLSSYDTGDIVESLDRLCNVFYKTHSHGYMYERGKYSSFNTGRLHDLGTLEARCFPLSTDGAVVAQWCQWLLNIKDMAVGEPDKTYRSLWKNVRQSPSWYAAKLFGHGAIGIPGVDNLLDLGTETGYELTKVLKKWYTKEEEAAKRPTAKKKPLFSGLSSGSQEVPQPVYGGSFTSDQWPTPPVATATHTLTPAQFEAAAVALQAASVGQAYANWENAQGNVNLAPSPIQPMQGWSTVPTISDDDVTEF